MHKGLVIVNTGEGKGKTTAALGTILRAWGQGLRICVIQFIKSEDIKSGEYKAAQALNIEWHVTGDGFTWLSKDMEKTIEKARLGWKLAQVKITSNEYDLILLDEFTYPLHYGWLHCDEIISWLTMNKPANLHLLITGRSAPPELIEYADIVSEITLRKHPYNQGMPAQPGIEY